MQYLSQQSWLPVSKGRKRVIDDTPSSSTCAQAFVEHGTEMSTNYDTLLAAVDDWVRKEETGGVKLTEEQ